MTHGAVAGGNAVEGQVVRWWMCNDSEAQRWHFSRDGVIFPGRLSPRNRPDLCLDPAGGSRANRNGQPMRLWRCMTNNPIHTFSVGDWYSDVCVGRGTTERRRQG
ncbi:hypothetical protein BCR44DRAFT_1215260 [Catenaria anguillulae PL171]|uniref:Ricin B lectin domain-containing protein n=1 Tax=Catenaria anguillulae PL171 TaxID=765915 RepID=A0A1Y2HYS7_9FUNG|nr:hypothetical protein BCR44DRAFT_1215260 [Catenaria anguillulae PL171]